MPRKKHTPEEIVAKLRQFDVLFSQGTAVADAVRQIGVTGVTCYRWRQEYGATQRRKAVRQTWRWLGGLKLDQGVHFLHLRNVTIEGDAVKNSFFEDAHLAGRTYMV